MGERPQDDLFRRAEEVFHEVEALPAVERPRLLERLCRGDDQLRAEVESLLAAAGAPDRSIGQLVDRAVGAAVDDQLAPGTSVGRYTVVSLLGRGGMGEVYLASQEQPVRRDVALKLVSGAATSRALLARFEAEAQALARMDHDAIAKVYDVGRHEGRPFYAMELVDGLPLDDYARQQELDVEGRLRLFVRICRGVHHAHQKGIIHRDLKPSNVLVGTSEGHPVVKIIDFGLAKAADAEPLGAAPATELGQVLGTPHYMSPEQANSLGADVDTRTDVYALGVILYELLTGQRPLDLSRAQAAGQEELLRAIREVEPLAPSRRLSSQDTALPAPLHEAKKAHLIRILRNDLDWVVMRALEKDRERRYPSVAALADDVERFLAHEPLEAGPPGPAYRLQKFVRRHRASVVAASLVVVALAGGLAAALSGLRAAQRAEAAAERQAAAAEQAAGFLAEVFDYANPERHQGQEPTVREVLDRAAQQLLDAPQQEPLLRAEMLGRLADVYYRMGTFDRRSTS